MRKNVKVVIIAFVAILGGGALGFFITGFALSGTLKKDFIFYYDPVSPSSIEQIKLNSDIGKMNIKYNTSDMQHYVKVEVAISMSGLFLANKDYTNFFRPSSEWWQNTTSPVIFNLEVLPNVWFDPSHWFKSYNITISVTLRTDIIYDLEAITATGSVNMAISGNVELDNLILMSSTGSVNLETQNNILMNQLTLSTSTGSVETTINQAEVSSFSAETSTGSVSIFANKVNFTGTVLTETSTGSLTLNFTNCIFYDDISGKVSTGSIDYKSYNAIYNTSLNLNLKTSTGGVDMEIYQYLDMGESLTGTLTTSTGSVSVLYRDTLTNIGVRFVGSTSTGSINYTPHTSMDILGNVYESINYGSANSKYSFTLTTSTGGIDADAQSAP